MADITKINLNGVSYNIKDATGGGGAVSSVNGKTGTVVLNSDDLAYDSSATHPSGTIGKELKEQSEKIVNLGSYSTTERVVGKWIDGTTDVWEKTIIINFEHSSGDHYFEHNIDDLETVITTNCIFNNTSTTPQRFIPITFSISNTNNFITICYVTNEKVYYYVSGGWDSDDGNLIFIIRYTKTTV